MPNHAKPHFTYVASGEPHALRRHAMLAAHPEIRQLFGVDRRVAAVTVAVIGAQLALAWAIARWSPSVLAVVTAALLVGAVLNHWLAMSIHETSHFLAFRSKRANRWLAIAANVPLLIPFAMSFHRYHLAHHRYLGVDTLDSDLPHDFEVRCIGRGSLCKLGWLLFNNVFYVVRGFSFADYPPNRWELVNGAVIVATTALLGLWVGPWGLAYLALSTAVGLSFHPVAAHFIHEHYTFADGQETFSYYGPLNAVTFNVGYHNEHHDFMNVPGARLPELRALAPEYYAHLASHTSWTAVLWRFVTSPELGLDRRIVRTEADFLAAAPPRAPSHP